MNIVISCELVGLPIREVEERQLPLLHHLRKNEYNPIRQNYKVWGTLDFAEKFKLISESDGILLSKDWQEHKECRLDKLIAEFYGLKVMYYCSQDVAPVKSAIMEAFDITWDEVMCKSRKRELVYARMIFATNAVKLGLTKEATGKHLKRDHSSVIHYEKNYAYDIKHTKEFIAYNDKVESLIELI